MKASIFFTVAALARHATSTGLPLLQWDPDTVADCVEWYNNGENESCESVRKMFGITPEVFHEWNPSVDLDCKPWNWQSYCIVTQQKLDQTKPTTSSSTTISTTTSSSTSLGPSPTAWTERGCYLENPGRPVLEQNLDPSGDTSLTIPSCKNSCYFRAYRFAGVQQGNQCWCSSYIGGEWTRNQSDCNTPCTGEKNTFCGGEGLLNVFEAEENQDLASSISTLRSAGTSAEPSIATKTSAEPSNATKTSGVTRNVPAMLWKSNGA
jgi:hypothetical protein